MSCGIGIDAGNMLATKTGVRRHGDEQGNYRNLAWLGRPANIASKLTDLANKPAETVQEKVVEVAYDAPAWNQLGGLFGLGLLNPPPANSLGALLAPGPPPSPSKWQWKEETLEEFLSKVEVKYVPSRLVHTDPNFGGFFLTERTKVIRADAPPILMTARVWKGFRSEQPDDPIIKNGWFKRVRVRTPGLTEAVIGGDVIFSSLKD